MAELVAPLTLSRRVAVQLPTDNPEPTGRRAWRFFARGHQILVMS